MKKNTLLFLLIISIALAVSSCKKEEITVTKVINVELKANESYSVVVPEGNANDAMQIISQAQHAAVSTVSVDPTTGNNVFNYTPAQDYSGSDEVQITKTEGGRQGSKNSQGGKCGSHHQNDKTVYVYNITVKADATVAKKVRHFRTSGCPSF